MSKNLNRQSKFLSYVLRHGPESIGLTLDASGWAVIDDLLARLAATGPGMSRDDPDGDRRDRLQEALHDLGGRPAHPRRPGTLHRSGSGRRARSSRPRRFITARPDASWSRSEPRASSRAVASRCTCPPTKSPPKRWARGTARRSCCGSRRAKCTDRATSFSAPTMAYG